MKNKIYAIFLGAIILTSILNIGITSGENTKNGNSIMETKSEEFQNHYAVIVGIGDYKGDINDLGCPDEEAQSMKSLLIQKGWKQENIRLIINKQAKRQNILDNLSWLSQKQGTVLFYYAGHGTQVKDQNGDEQDSVFAKDEALVTWEATIETVILDDELQIILDGFNADNTVCIFVTCFAGGFIEDDNNKAAPKTTTLFRKIITFFPNLAKILVKPFVKNLLLNTFYNNQDQYELHQPMEELQSNNRVILTACQENRQTYEFPIISQPFAVFIRNGFKGGFFNGTKVDKNDNGQISAEEAFNYAQPRATLEAAIAMGAPFSIIGAIKGWIEGNATLLEVLYICAIYGFIIPVPQIYDSDINQEINLTSNS